MFFCFAWHQDIDFSSSYVIQAIYQRNGINKIHPLQVNIGMESRLEILMRIKDKMLAEKGDVPTSFRKCSGRLGRYGLWFRVLGKKTP
jgi:hypothetical protein